MTFAGGLVFHYSDLGMYFIDYDEVGPDNCYDGMKFPWNPAACELDSKEEEDKETVCAAERYDFNRFSRVLT